MNVGYKKNMKWSIVQLFHIERLRNNPCGLTLYTVIPDRKVKKQSK